MQIKKEDILHTGNLELLAKKAVEGFITGIHKSPFHGFSVEFAEHRQYNAGETTKNIDWKLFGRTDKLYSKRYEEETNLRCRFLIDTSKSMQIESSDSLSKLQYAIWCTSVFTQLLKKQRDASGLSFFDDKILDSTKVGSSGRHYKELIGKLEPYLSYSSKKVQTSVSGALHAIANQMHRRSMIVLFTDFLEENRDLESLFDAIKHLKHNKHEVIVFHTMHKPSEIDFNFGTAPVSFEDAESGEVIKLQPSEIKEQYIERMHKYNSQIKLKLMQYKIDYVEADTSKPIEYSVIPFLTKRRSMGR